MRIGTASDLVRPSYGVNTALEAATGFGTRAAVESALFLGVEHGTEEVAFLGQFCNGLLSVRDLESAYKSGVGRPMQTAITAGRFLQSAGYATMYCGQTAIGMTLATVGMVSAIAGGAMRDLGI